MTRRKIATPVVRPVVLPEGQTLKERAKRHGMRAITYSNGQVRLRTPGAGYTDFPTREMADDYLDVRERSRGECP